MTKVRISLLLPLAITGSLLIYCWMIILTTDVLSTWRHWAGVILFIPVSYLFIKDVRKGTIATGIYLLLGMFNVLAITTTITTSWIGSDSLHTPPVQLLFLGIFLLYFIINFKSLIDIYLDYKEAKALKRKKFMKETSRSAD